MVQTVSLTQIEIGLSPVAQDAAGLTLIVFIAMSLLTTLGLRFTYYAHRNLMQTEITIQKQIWILLRYTGGFASLFGIAGLVEIVSSLAFAEKHALLLAVALFLALTLREIQLTATGSAGLFSPSLERLLHLFFGGLIVFYVLVTSITGQTKLTALIQGVSALASISYGGSYFLNQTSDSRLQGTMLDSLVRHLLPVLAFSSLVGLVALAIPFGLERIIALHIQAVFLIMTATSLMTATIKLRQNLATLS